jgi:DNA-binding transcriptional regulator YdaS (Cro superfamily)
MNRTSFITALALYVKRAGSQRLAAQQLGVSDAYLCDVKKGRRDPGPKLLTALGLRRVVEYERAQ